MSQPAEQPKGPQSAAAALAFNEANSAARSGDHVAVIASCHAALAAEPDLARAHILLARSHRALGQIDDAETAYRAALTREPAEFSSLLELGNLLRDKGQHGDALACYCRAVAARPTDQRGHLALALLCQDNSLPDARRRGGRHYQIALQLAAGQAGYSRAQVHRHIGHRRMALADVAGACEAFQAGLACLEATERAQPQGGISDALGEMLLEVSEAFTHLDLQAQAVAALERAARAEGGAVLLKVADRCYRQNLWREAIAILERAVALHPEDVDMHLALAEMQSKSWLLERAARTLEGISAPLSAQQRHRTGLLRAQIANRMGDADGAIAEYDALGDLTALGLASSVAMTALYSSAADPEQWALRNQRAFAAWGRGARRPAEFSSDRSSDRPLRIGMVTADLHHQHPVNLFLQPMLAGWNGAEFPLTIYHTGTTFDDQTRLAQRRAGQWRNLAPDALAAAVAADRIDILIDLSGHTHSAELRQFAQRMAPVQATYLGYPGSTQVPNIDYLIGDRLVTPPEHAHLYSERLMPLDTAVFCYAPEEDYPSPRFDQARPVTFGSFNTVTKLNGHTVALWADILHAVPDARLLLKAPSFKDPGTQRRFRSLFAERGIAADRLELRGPSGLAEMMAEYGDVDIGLDTMPYNGGTTTLQALWMGVPVVTKTGAQFVSRMGASFLQHAGMSDWVAQTDEDYVNIAIRQASDRDALLTLKKNLRANLLLQPSWNIKSHLAGMETGLKKMWAQGPLAGWEEF